MKKFYSSRRFLLLLSTLLIAVLPSISQTTINTTVGSTGYTDGNGVTGNSCVTFVIENTSGADILLNQVSNYFQTASNGTNVALWYSSTSLSGAVTVATPAWTQIATGGPIAISANGIYDLFTGLSFTIPSGAQYRFAIQSSINMRYAGTAAGQADPDIFTVGGVSLKCGEAVVNGSLVGYAGAFPTPPNSPRWFIGSVTFSPASPCTAPPVAGNATTNSTAVCSGSSVVLGLTGNSTGTGQTYQWQTSPTAAGVYTDMGSVLNGPSTTINPTSTAWYRAKVTCSGQSAFSQPVQVVVNALFPGGTYTINSGISTGGTNFQTFTAAVDAIKCGISGPIIFKVAPGSGPYNEQVTIPSIGGSSSTNTVTFKGSLSTLSFNSTNANQRAGITLDGADYITIDSLNITATGSSASEYGWGVQLTNGADNNKVSNCTISVSTTNSTAYNFLGVVLGGSATTPISATNGGSNNIISGNTIMGGYYPVVAYGNSTTPYPTGNVISSNTIQDGYSYSVYVYGNVNGVVSKNNISRPARSATTTTAGVYLSTGTTGMLVEKNTIHNMFDAAATSTSTMYGVYVGGTGTAASPNKVINNLLYNANGNGIIYGIYNTTSPYMQAYHNTIVLDDQATAAGAAYGFYQTGAATGIDFRNNLVYITRSGTGIKRALYFVTTTSTITSNNNVLYLNSGSGTNNNLGQFGTNNYAALSDWKTANGNIYDQQSISTDPAFSNPGGGEFVPTTPSVNNLGANVGVTTDIREVARLIASPDPGAYEFSLGGCTNPPVTGNVIPSVTDACPNTPFSFDLSGNSVGDGQTYQWQSSPSNAANSWTNIGTASTSSSYTTSQTTTTYYRVAVKCNSGTTVFSQSVLITSPALVSGTFSIDNTLPPTATRFQTFADAINSVKCGINGPVVFNVKNNVYNESVTIPPIIGTSATNTVTFNGNGATIFYNSTDAANRTGIMLNGADHIILDSLLVDVSQGTYGWGIVLTNQADSNIIRKCVINNNTSSTTATNNIGIAINGSATATATTGNNGNGNLITGNTITGGYYGIYLYGSTAPYNKRNVIKNNVVQEMYSYGIYLYGNDSITISSNEITRPGRSAVTTTYGIYVSTNTNVLLEKNRIHNLFDAATTNGSSCYPLYVASSGTSAVLPSRVENNLIYNINNGVGLIYGIYGAGYNNWNYYHNTVVLDDAAATAGTTYGMYVYGTAVNVKNNIVYVNRGGTGGKYCLYYSTTGVTSSNNNVLVMNSTTGTINSIGYYNAGYATFAAWQAANGAIYDQQSQNEDPGFANPSGGDFIPTSSFVNNIGQPVDVLTDIAGLSRSNTTPDPGSYEFSTLTAGVNMAAETLVTPGTSAKGCYTNSEPVTIKIRNNSYSTINFATNPVTVTVNVTGAATQTLTRVLNVGTLASDSTLNVVMSSNLNMTATGTYTFNAYTSVPGDANTANDPIRTTTRTREALTAGTAVAAPDNYCAPSPINPVLSTTSNNGYSGLQWKESLVPNGAYTNIANATAASYVVTSPLTQTKYYKLFATCGTLVDSSGSVMVAYKNPQVTGTTPATRCGTGTVTLGVAGNSGSSFNWYSAPSGGTLVGTGSSFTTPSISSTTNYYVAANNGYSSQTYSVGYINTAGYSFITQTIGWGALFTANTDCKIDSIGVYPTGTGTVTIQILDPANAILYTGPTTNISGTGTEKIMVPVGAVLLAGNYKMGMSYTGVTNLGSQPTGSTMAYPFVSPPLTITSGSQGAGAVAAVYYWFYDWRVSVTVGCEGPRSAVAATVDCNAFPVTVTDFKGERQGAINKLEWTTLTEINNSGFELQRGANGREFSPLIFVASKATNGNSTGSLTYNFDDMKPLTGAGFYRLKQVDKDGKFSYSKVVVIKGGKIDALTLSSIYPNPVNSVLNLIVSSPNVDAIKIVVTDVSGKIVSQKDLKVVTGDNQFSLPVINLASGSYFIKAICANGCETAVQKFVKQ